MAAAKAPEKVDGVRAVEMLFRPVRDIASGSQAFYHTQTRLNTPTMGVLTSEQFRPVSDLTSQCIELFWLELQQALDSIKAFDEREISFQWISVYMPPHFLREASAEHQLVERFSMNKIATNRICFELGGALFDEEQTAGLTMRNLRNRGFHFMLSGFGGTNCPMMRLADFPVDYVMLSPELAGYLERGERSEGAVKSVISFVSDLEAEAIADGVRSSHQAELLHSFECSYIAGALAGHYLQARYIRSKDDD